MSKIPCPNCHQIMDEPLPLLMSKAVGLSPFERVLVERLAKNESYLVLTDDLVCLLWPDSEPKAPLEKVSLFVKRARKKLAPFSWNIFNKRGEGYYLARSNMKEAS